MSETDNALTAYLKNNPRMIGALAALCFLLTQASGALARHAETIAGP